jgi:prepilin peptidase CpaA
MQVLTLPLTVAVLGASAWAVREDLVTHRIPNRLTGTLLAVGVALQCTVDGWRGIEDGILGALVGLAMLLPFYLLRGMGAGDVKLFAALGAALGPHWALVAGVDTIIAGGVLAIGYLLCGAIRAGLAPMGAPWSVRLHCAYERAQQLRREPFPYALAIAAGVIAALQQRGDLQLIYHSLHRVHP